MHSPSAGYAENARTLAHPRPSHMNLRPKSAFRIGDEQHIPEAAGNHRQKRLVQIGEPPKSATARFLRTIPPRILGHKRLFDQSKLIHFENTIAVPRCGRGADPIEFDPCAGTGHLLVEGVVFLRLSVDPDELGERRLAGREDFELLYGRGSTSTGVRGDRQATFAGDNCGRFDELSVQRVQWGIVDSDFDEARFHSVDAGFEFAEPAPGELFGGLGFGVVGQEDMVSCAVETGVGPKVDAGSFGQAAKEARIAAEVVGRALLEAGAAVFLQCFEVRPADFKGILEVVAVA